MGRMSLEEIRAALFTPEGLQELVRSGGVVAVSGIVFAETGLMLGFFLPGDSLLFIAGFVAGLGHLSLPALQIAVSLAAITGDAVGYWIGARAGHAIYDRPDSLWHRKRHLSAARAFYEKHGGKTIVLARFVPIVRTFAPVVAGAAGMTYRRFATFNIFGGIFWVLGMTTLGFYLGKVPWVQRNLEKAVLIVILLSILPMLIEWWRARRAPVSETAS